MAKKSSSTPKTQNGTNSPKPLIPKAGVTHSGQRSY